MHPLLIVIAVETVVVTVATLLALVTLVRS
jgi:hypothetical protein